MKIYVFFFLQCLFVSAFGTTIVVRQSTGNDFLSAIQRAAAHDTILLKHGIYKEHDIVVKKPLVIISREGAKIDGEGKYQLLILNHDSIVVEGITFQNSGSSGMTDMAGVKAVTADHVVLSNNIFLNTTYGIYLQNCSYTTIVGNQIKGRAADELNNGNGIHAWKSGHLLIRDNDVTGQRDGIYFEFVTDSRIFHNNSHDNVRYGLHFMFSHRDRYAQNSFVDNGSGVAVMYSKFVEMTDNVFRHNWGEASYGILLKEISDSKICHNLFERNTVAIYMEGTSRIETRRNTFTNNGWAMRIQASCMDNVFAENNFLGNSFDVATNGTMMLNNFDGNYWDKYDGYDLNRDRKGDVPYYPVSLFSVVSEKVPDVMILYRSMFTSVMDQVEKVLPTLTPDKLKDVHPMMKPIAL